MATETYKYYIPDPDLRPAYGGATIQATGDSAEVPPATLSQRYMCQQLGLPIGGTRFLFEVGVATDTNTYCRIPDLLWPDVQSLLSSSEAASVVSSAPAGWTKGSVFIKYQPDPRRFTWIIAGESIPAGTGASPADPRSTWPTQLINGIAGQTIIWDDVTNYRDGYSPRYRLLNLAVPSSSWGNTVPSGSGGGENTYPWRFDLAYNQRFKTIPMNSRRCLWTPTLLTNDAAYDTSLTSAQLWARAYAQLLTVRSDFPNLLIAPATTGKRTNGTTLNGRIQGANDLLRANWSSMGLNGLFDIEANCPSLNMVTGDMTDVSKSTDGVHWTNLVHAEVGAAMRSEFVRLAAL